jgi:hypothetical protein
MKTGEVKDKNSFVGKNNKFLIFPFNGLFQHEKIYYDLLDQPTIK